MNTENQKTILLVDDDEDFLLQTRAILEGAGFRVIPAEGLRASEPLVAAGGFDLVVADLMMEHPDAGFVLCHRVKKKNPKMPVILCSAVSAETGMAFSAKTAEERSWLGADAVLTKPVRPEQLRREVDRLLGR
jgi:CheY-like chemotaxis protein